MRALLLVSLSFLTPSAPAAQSGYFTEDALEPLGVGQGVVERLRAARLDPGFASPDLVVLQGGRLELRLDPSVQTPTWGTVVDAEPRNDFAVLHGAGAEGEDQLVSIGADGLARYDWDHAGTGAFARSSFGTEAWKGGEFLEVWGGEGKYEFFGVGEERTKLLFGSLDEDTWTDGTVVDLPSGLTDLEVLDLDGDDRREVALLIDGLGLAVLDEEGSVVAGWATPGGNEHVCVSRSTHAGEPDLLVLVTHDVGTNLDYVVALGESGPVAFVVLPPETTVALEAADVDGDGRDDVVVLADDDEQSESRATFVLRTSSTTLAVDALGLLTNLDRDGTMDSPSRAFAPADFDCDGDVDLLFVPADVAEQRLWYSPAIDQDARRSVLTCHELSSTASTVDLDLEVEVPELATGTHLLVEVWRMPSGLVDLEFEKQLHRRVLVPRLAMPPESGSLCHVTHWVPVQLESESGAVDDPVFRIDLTVVTLGGADGQQVVDTDVTIGWWYTHDFGVGQALGDLVYWPTGDPAANCLGFDVELPGNTSGSVTGSGSSPGGPPPQRR